MLSRPLPTSPEKKILLRPISCFKSIKIENDKPLNRLNDGKIDSKGRLWFGTMDNLESKRSGSLYCLDNYLRLHKIDDKYFTQRYFALKHRNNFSY